MGWRFPATTRWVLVMVIAALLVLPAASALDIGTRSIKARPSAEYSPDTAWELGAYGCGVTIAVFDEGVDDRHPYLDGKVVAGYDSTMTQPFWTAANGGNPQPLVGTHGTPVAGLALSHAGQPFFTSDDVPDYPQDARAGVAPCAWLVDVQFSDLGPDAESFDENVIQAFEWAIAHKDDDWGDADPSNDGIDIITMSWSPYDQTDGTDPISQVVTRAVEAGIVVLGSAGNSGSAEEPDIGTPSGADGTLAIANLWNERTVTRADDVLAESSTWGPRTDDGDDDPYEELKPDVASPGMGVVGTGASAADGREYSYVCFGPDDPVAPPAVSCEVSFGGTSAATPMTAGVVALMLQVNGELTPPEIKEILHQTAQPHPDQTPSAPDLSAKWNHRYGYGMTDAFKAVTMAMLWPGMDLGKDTDADGVRDFMDQAPRNPRLANITVPAGFVLPEDGHAVDTDGDLVPDATDPDPLDPWVSSGADGGAALEDPEAPAPGAAAFVVLLAFVVFIMRRRG